MVAVMVLFFLLTADPVAAQDGITKPSKSVAQAAWMRGDYETAFDQYNALLLLYSRDPLYQYYTGACLVRMERDIQRSVMLLSSAINSSVHVKSVPDDVWFYYGRALQMSGSFSQAIEAFDRFIKVTGRKTSAEYEVRKYLDQCNEGVGAIGESESPPREAVVRSKPETVMPNPVLPEPVQQEQAILKPALQEPAISEPVRPKAARTEPVVQKPVVRGNVTGVPKEQYRVLGEAVELRHDADSLGLQAERAALEAEKARPEDKERLEKRAADEAAKAEARAAEADSLLLTLGRDEDQTPDTPPVTVPASQPEVRQLSHFEVRPGPAYSNANPVPVDPAMPEGLAYTIQIAAFRNDVSPSLFKGLFPVFGRKRQGSDAVYFYAGLFRRLDDAMKALPEARGAGFPDAFIIAMMNGAQVSMERAAQLAREWSAQPLTVNKTVAGSHSEQPDQPVPVETLSFRAEVMRIDKPVKPDVIQKIEQLAGTRGLEMIKNNNGETVFLIGNFITFESADEYVSLLIRNGYSSARVAAYVGMQEISVDAAMELINKPPDD